MPNDMEIAFDEFLDAAEGVLGERVKVTFRGGEIDAFIFRQEEDPQPAPGGISDVIPQRIAVKKSSVALPIICLGQRGAEKINIRGQERTVLSFLPLEGRTEIIAGDEARQMED